MKAESMVITKADHHERMFLKGVVALAVVATILPATQTTLAAPQGSGAGGKSSAVTLEPIPNSTIKRVILTAKAAERLGIETGKVGIKPVVHKQMVSGLVTYQVKKPPKTRPEGGLFGGYASTGMVKVVTLSRADAAAGKTSASGEAWVSVALSPAEYERLAKDKMARILPLATRDSPAKELLAKPSDIPPLEDVKRSMLRLYYVVPGMDHGLTLGQRMRVELEMTDSDGNESNGSQRVVPYGAVYYDAHGNAWVYVNTKPLVFERRPIIVERVVGDIAFLSEGPPVDTPVVTVGAAMLYGTEIFGK
jgi:hypothetical protein